MVSVATRRRVISYAVEGCQSQRRACELLSVSRSALFYTPRLRPRDVPMIEAMMTLSASIPDTGTVELGSFWHAKAF